MKTNYLWLRRYTLLAAAFVVSSSSAWAQRTQLKPGWNMFSPQQDIEVGKQNALQAEKQLPLCNDPKVDAYLTKLGLRLAEKLPTNGVQYPFEFHCVNDKAINAFALPGGYVFVNRGAIEAADDEAQLAGVMAHELSHVALRHGTNQATKAQATQGFLGIAGGIFGGSTSGALLTQLGSFAAGSVLLRYSRSAETQADVMGTQVLYDTGYDPRAMAQFFEKLEAETKGKNPPEFFSDHPNPDHRVERVMEEVDKLGGVPSNGKKDSLEFQSIKRAVMALPVVKKPTIPSASATAANPPAAPSGRMVSLEASTYTLSYPDNWKNFGDKNDVTLAPDGGVVSDAKGNGALAYGFTAGTAKTDANSSNSLENATQQLIQGLQKSNPNMRVARQAEHVKLNGEPGISTYLSNDSPIGGQEVDWIITVMRPEGLFYFVCTAPQKDYATYEKACGSILDSVRFSH